MFLRIFCPMLRKQQQISQVTSTGLGLHSPVSRGLRPTGQTHFGTALRQGKQPTCASDEEDVEMPGSKESEEQDPCEFPHSLSMLRAFHLQPY